MPVPHTREALRTSVKGALIFSTVLATVAAVITTVVATGGFADHSSRGAAHSIRLDLGLIAFGVTFIVTLVLCAMLALTHRENPEQLGEGSGVNTRSADRLQPGGAHPPPGDTPDGRSHPGPLH